MRLYKIRPIGLETEDVESLSSYVIRLAIAHGVSVGLLLDYLKVAYRKEFPEWEQSRVNKANPESLVTMVRPVDSAAELIDVLAHFTGVDSLRSCTFQALREICYSSRGLFADNLRWCPECFVDDRRLGSEPYLRLIWSFKEVVRCHKHNAPIITRCPNCFRKQNSKYKR